jgi:hypothetical protein
VLLGLAALASALSPDSVETSEAPKSPSPTPPAARTERASDTDAGGKPLHIPSDPRARYFVLQQAGTANRPTLITTRIGSSGASFSHKAFDCSAKSFTYLGDGATLEEMRQSRPGGQMEPLVEGSISHDQWRYVCRD